MEEAQEGSSSLRAKVVQDVLWGGAELGGRRRRAADLVQISEVALEDHRTIRTTNVIERLEEDGGRGEEDGMTDGLTQHLEREVTSERGWHDFPAAVFGPGATNTTRTYLRTPNFAAESMKNFEARMLCNAKQMPEERPSFSATSGTPPEANFGARMAHFLPARSEHLFD